MPNTSSVIFGQRWSNNWQEKLMYCCLWKECTLQLGKQTRLPYTMIIWIDNTHITSFPMRGIFDFWHNFAGRITDINESETGNKRKKTQFFWRLLFVGLIQLFLSFIFRLVQRIFGERPQYQRYSAEEVCTYQGMYRSKDWVSTPMVFEYTHL